MKYKKEAFVLTELILQIGFIELRTLFGLVLQDHSIFTGTVYENIALGNSDISLAK